jgi:hypothetical protein
MVTKMIIIKLEYIPLYRQEVKRILKNTNLKIIWKIGNVINFDELNLKNLKKIKGEYFLIGKWYDGEKEKQEFVGSLLIVNVEYRNEYGFLTESNERLRAFLMKKLLFTNLKKAKLFLFDNEGFGLVGSS